MSPGKECRKAVHECDLPEFCTGESEYCPDDVYKMNGETCRAGKVNSAGGGVSEVNELLGFRRTAIKANAERIPTNVNYYGAIVETIQMMNAMIKTCWARGMVIAASIDLIVATLSATIRKFYFLRSRRISSILFL